VNGWRAKPFGLFVLVFGIVAAAAQSPARFDVASIKPNSDGDYRVSVTIPPGGRFSATGITLRFLMRYAFDIQDLQITGGPRWIGSDRWDVEAKVEGLSNRLTVEQQKRTLQALLADRFQLRVHSEKSKQMPAYILVIASHVAKLKENTREPGPNVNVQSGKMTFQKVRLSALTSQLTQRLGRQVFDKTNLMGEYDFTLNWTPEPGENGPVPGQPAPPDPSSTGGPSIFTALQEQLGLKLVPTKAPLDVLVIDRAEHPSSN